MSIIKICARCGSTDVTADVACAWNTSTQSWEQGDMPYDDAVCQLCDCGDIADAVYPMCFVILGNGHITVERDDGGQQEYVRAPADNTWQAQGFVPPPVEPLEDIVRAAIRQFAISDPPLCALLSNARIVIVDATPSGAAAEIQQGGSLLVGRHFESNPSLAKFIASPKKRVVIWQHELAHAAYEAARAFYAKSLRALDD